MKTRCNFLNEALKLVMERLGRHIARRPLVFIFFSFIVSIILGLGFVVSVYETISPEYITITGGKYEDSKRMMLSMYPVNTSKYFDPARAIELPSGPLIYILSKNGSGLIDKSIFRDIVRLDKIVRNASIETEKGLMNYTNLCAIENSACFLNPLMKITRKIDRILNGEYRFKYPIDINPRTYEVIPFVVNIGGVTTDEKGYVKDFIAVRLFYYGDNSNVSKRAYIRKWERALMRQIAKVEFETIDAYVAAFSEAAADIHTANEKLFYLSFVVIVTVILFSMLAFITNSRIRSKPWLGCAAGLSATLAILTAYGTMFYAGITLSDLTLLVAFFVLGTEIDDAFIMVASWRSTNPKDSVEERVARTYSEAAVSVTVSSLTSFVAYSVGITAPILVVRSVCMQCAICIIFTYLYQLFLFGPFMALDGYREKSERNAFTFCSLTTDKNNCSKKVDHTIDEKEETLMKCLRDNVGGFLQFPICKAICLTLFAANITVSSIFAMNLRKGSDMFDILSPGSQTERAVSTQVTYFPAYQHSINIVINKTLNYWEKDVQKSIANMLKSFEDHPNIADSNLTLSWLKFYLTFAEIPAVKSSFMSYDISIKENFFHGLLKAFLRLKPARQFTNDLIFNENYTEIISSRYIVFCTNLSTVDDEAKLLKDVEEIAAKSEIPISIYSTLFIQGEQASIIGKITVQTIWITSLLMFIIFLIFIANIPHAILVAICVTSSMIGTLGFMAAWGIKLDIVSLIVVVTCLGFSINYSAHMSYAFTTSQADTSNEKMKESLYRVGLPVIQGSLSTIIAVMVLLFQDIYVYVAGFKVILLTVMETSFHALVVLPVILSLFDSCLNSRSKEKKKKRISLSGVVESYHL